MKFATMKILTLLNMKSNSNLASDDEFCKDISKRKDEESKF